MIIDNYVTLTQSFEYKTSKDKVCDTIIKEELYDCCNFPIEPFVNENTTNKKVYVVQHKLSLSNNKEDEHSYRYIKKNYQFILFSLKYDNSFLLRLFTNYIKAQIENALREYNSFLSIEAPLLSQGKPDLVTIMSSIISFLSKVKDLHETKIVKIVNDTLKINGNSWRWLKRNARHFSRVCNDNNLFDEYKISKELSKLLTYISDAGELLSSNIKKDIKTRTIKAIFLTISNNGIYNLTFVLSKNLDAIDIQSDNLSYRTMKKVSDPMKSLLNQHSRLFEIINIENFVYNIEKSSNNSRCDVSKTTFLKFRFTNEEMKYIYKNRALKEKLTLFYNVISLYIENYTDKSLLSTRSMVASILNETKMVELFKLNLPNNHSFQSDKSIYNYFESNNTTNMFANPNRYLISTIQYFPRMVDEDQDDIKEWYDYKTNIENKIKKTKIHSFNYNTLYNYATIASASIFTSIAFASYLQLNNKFEEITTLYQGNRYVRIYHIQKFLNHYNNIASAYSYDLVSYKIDKSIIYSIVDNTTLLDEFKESFKTRTENIWQEANIYYASIFQSLQLLASLGAIAAGIFLACNSIDLSSLIICIVIILLGGFFFLVGIFKRYKIN